jgi:uncharacterized membrane protein YciS (DUF1049 family)
MLTLDDIATHPLLSSCFNHAISVLSKLGEKQQKLSSTDMVFERLPNEGELYIIHVGHTASHLIGVLDQLDYIPLYLLGFSPTKQMKKADLNSAKHIQYTIENYIIRTQSVYDRILSLVDAVFHLGTDVSQLSHELIVTNIHVKHEKVETKLKSLRKVLREYIEERNSIIHHRGLLDEKLRKLEAFYILKSKSEMSSEIKKYDGFRKLSQRDLVKSKRVEFEQFNQKIFERVRDVLDSLHQPYKDRCNYFGFKLGSK